jgi:ATP-dependent helicase/nuclease subunit B
MSSVFSITDLLQMLGRGETLVLPNSGAARALRVAYDSRQRERGLAVWEPASVLAWSQWANSLYSDLVVNGAESRLVLNAAQEQSLWREVIGDDPPAEALGSTQSLAELAASAFKLAAAWNATARLRTSATNEDTRTFARWADEFSKRCMKQGCLSAVTLDVALTQHVVGGTLDVPKTLLLVGFEEITPARAAFLEALEKAGTAITRSALGAIDGEQFHVKVVAETPREEIELAARWIRQKLETVPVGELPRIAVLVPDVGSDRAEIEDVFREVLAPELQSIKADLSSTPWEFSSGVPLSSLAMIADALDVARWVKTPLPQNRITALLLSPYLGAEREYAAQVDTRIRGKEKLLRPELGLDAFVALIEKHESSLTWPRNLATEISRSGDLSKARSYADWMELFRKLIQATGWPGQDTRALSATEFEQTRAWDGVLDLVSTLDFSGRKVSLDAALEALELQAQTTQFVPPSNSALVQVMTPSEAEGVFVDAVLFLHATDENWPPRERAHPLLSWQLQSSLSMPGADPAKTVARTAIFTRELLRRTNTVLFFSAKENESGHLRSSPLLSELGLTAMDVKALGPPFRVEEVIAYDVIADDSELPQLPSTEVQGGARVLQLQAACGFRAFAELRLKAAEPDTSDIGLNAMESGSIVHHVLQQFWNETKTHADLAAMSAEMRDDRLRRCIEETISKERSRPDSRWDAAYLSVVRERLLQLLKPWLELELARSPFTVLDTEREEFIDVGPLRLKVRIDRIDSAQDGSVLIDYKTGASARPSQWGVPRPEEPQLPLYTMLLEPDEVKAVAFAKILAGEKLAWLGMQAETGILPMKKADDLLIHIDDWRMELTRLAEEFAAGRATVSPKEYPLTCRYCSQRLLCRVDPATLAALAEEEQEDADG